MHFDVGVPSGAIKHYEAWVGDGHLKDFAVAAEKAGMDGVYVTDHPFPEDAWLANGGHHAFDPFVALSSMAAVTSRIRLRTNLLVAAYRNPWLTARSCASLDVLSGGRLIVGMGVGYLKAEFEVLGADFENRGRKFDEAIVAMTKAWTGETVHHDGPFFPAHGHSMLPRPVQQPRPPIWIGGNSKAAMRRAAVLADGWMPFPQPAAMAKITGSPALSGLEELKPMIEQAREMRAAAGRTEPLDLAFGPSVRPDMENDPDGNRYLESLQPCLDAGVTWVSLGCRSRTMQACFEELEWLGKTIVAPWRAAHQEQESVERGERR